MIDFVHWCMPCSSPSRLQIPHLPLLPLRHRMMWVVGKWLPTCNSRFARITLVTDKSSKLERKLTLHFCSGYTFRKYILRGTFLHTQVTQAVAVKIWIAFNRKVNNSVTKVTLITGSVLWMAVMIHVYNVSSSITTIAQTFLVQFKAALLWHCSQLISQQTRKLWWQLAILEP